MRDKSDSVCEDCGGVSMCVNVSVREGTCECI